MKKFLLILIVVILFIAIGVPLTISFVMAPRLKAGGKLPSETAERKEYIFENSEPWDQNKGEMRYFGYKVPSDSELENLKNAINLSRKYPETLKAVFAPGPVPNSNELLYFSDELANIGINTYWVIGEYQIENNRAFQFMPGFDKAGFPGVLSQDDAKKILAWRILLAKKAGFASILIPDFPSVFNIGRANFEIEKLKPEFERVALELARIAEEYQAEYLAPVNEYDHMLYSNGYTLDEIARLENEFYGEITPKIRQIFHGRIIYKTGNIGEWSDFPKLSMKGADLFGVGNAYTGGAGKITKDETEKAQAADLVSARDNVPWFESEFLVYRPIDQQNWMGRVESIYPMEKSYKEGTDAFEKTAKRAIGFTFMSWTGVGRIRKTAAADIIKDFFTRWKPSEKLSPEIDLPEFNSEAKDSPLIEWIKNLPAYYITAYDILTGKMKPQKDKAYGEGGPAGCKNKAECEAYCAKPENKDICTRFGGKSGVDNNNLEQKSSSPQLDDRDNAGRGGPGGCRSDEECRAYCDKPENAKECFRFKK